MSGKPLPHEENPELIPEFWRLWRKWWQLRTCPDPKFHQYPRREKETLSIFTELYELRGVSIQEGLLKKGF